MAGEKNVEGGRARGAGGRARSGGFTLLEVLLALAVFAVGVLATSHGLLGSVRGVTRDGKVGAANQVGVGVIEKARDLVSNAPANYDAAPVSATERPAVGGLTYTATYTVTPKTIDASGALQPPAAGATPHVYLVEATVTWPGGTPQTFATLVHRPKTGAP